MADDKLVEYIKKQLDAGYEIENIRQTLKKYGYSDIEGAIGEALGKTDKNNPHVWIIVGVALLAILVIGGAIIFAVNSLSLSKPSVETPNTPAEPVDSGETETETPPISTLPSDVKLGPPAKEATYDNPVELPTLAIEIEKNQTVEFVISVFVTDYITSLEPMVECDTGNNVLTSYPFSGDLNYGEVHHIAFIIEADQDVVFTECSVAFPTTDNRPMAVKFAIFVM